MANIHMDMDMEIRGWHMSPPNNPIVKGTIDIIVSGYGMTVSYDIERYKMASGTLELHAHASGRQMSLIIEDLPLGVTTDTPPTVVIACIVQALGVEIAAMVAALRAISSNKLTP